MKSEPFGGPSRLMPSFQASTPTIPPEEDDEGDLAPNRGHVVDARELLGAEADRDGGAARIVSVPKTALMAV